MFLISLNVNIPRYFIQRDLGAGLLGVYAAVGYVLIAGTTLITSVGQAASPRLAKYYASGDKTAFLKLVKLLILVGSLLALAAILLVEVGGRDFVIFVYGHEYAGNLDFFRLLTIAAGIGFIGSFIGYAVTAARYFFAQAPLYAGVVALTAAGCALLIPHYGLTGAGWVAVGSTALQLAGGVVILVLALRGMERGFSESRQGHVTSTIRGIEGNGSGR
jgi:O-antigen/teichoic acid export membrane protein